MNKGSDTITLILRSIAQMSHKFVISQYNNDLKIYYFRYIII